MNIRVHESFQISVFMFSGYTPAVELMGHMVVPFLVLRGASVLISTVTVAICIHTNSIGRFPFLNILTSICYLSSF